MSESGVVAEGKGIADLYRLVDGADGAELHCAGCGHSFGPATDDPKLGAVVATRALSEISELNRFTTDELVLREFYCPGCGVMIAANVQRPSDPVMTEMRLA